MGDYDELMNKWDGVGGDRRLAWYGQLRASGMDHRDAMKGMRKRWDQFAQDCWPARGIDLEEDK